MWVISLTMEEFGQESTLLAKHLTKYRQFFLFSSDLFATVLDWKKWYLFVGWLQIMATNETGSFRRLLLNAEMEIEQSNSNMSPGRTADQTQGTYRAIFFWGWPINHLHTRSVAHSNPRDLCRVQHTQTSRFLRVGLACCWLSSLFQ